jgi:hypothetical protein
VAQGSLGKTMRRRKEVVLLVIALAVGAFAAAKSASSWIQPERWGPPIAAHPARSESPVPQAETIDFSAIWQGGGRNPFGYAASELEAGGRAGLPLPPLPAVFPEMPPAPMPTPLDVLMEGVQ